VTTHRRDVDRLLECRWVVPVEPHGVILEHHAVALAGDTIADVLPIAAAPKSTQMLHASIWASTR